MLREVTGDRSASVRLSDGDSSYCLLSNLQALMITCDASLFIYQSKERFNRLTPTDSLTCKNANEAVRIFSMLEMQREAPHYHRKDLTSVCVCKKMSCVVFQDDSGLSG